MSVVARPGRSHIHKRDATQDVEEENSKRLKKLKKPEGAGSQIPEESSIPVAGSGAASTINSSTGGGIGMLQEDLHIDFLLAVFNIGLKYASPKLLLEKMPDSNVVTMDRIKSHLQKIRQNKSRSYKEFLQVHERLLMGGLRTWTYGLENILADETGSEKKGDCENIGELNSALPSQIKLNPNTSEASQKPPYPSFSPMDLALVRDTLGLGLPDYIPVELGSSVFKSSSSNTVKAPTIPMLDSSSSMGFSTVKAPTIPTLDGSSSMGFSTVKAPTIPTLGSSSSMGLNNGFSLEASKSSDGQATSMDWSGYNPPPHSKLIVHDALQQPHGYDTAPPSGAGTRAAQPSDSSDSRYKTSENSLTNNPIIPAENIPHLEVDVSEALQDLLNGLNVPPQA